MFTKHFDHFVCHGDSIRCEVDGFTAVATLHHDTGDFTPPDERCEGFWPSLDPDDAGYIGPRSHRTLARQRAFAQHVLDSWKRDEWHYFGVAVVIFREGVQLTPPFDHALWGIEGNYPVRDKRKNTNAYFRDVANQYLPDALDAAKAKLAALAASHAPGAELPCNRVAARP
jgi:hypothetical protein